MNRNEELDLWFERDVAYPPELLWASWTEPERLVQWFTPRPWRTESCTIDLRPGGEFSTTMAGPNGEVHSASGCYLEVVPNARLVWTNAVQAGFRPTSSAVKPDLRFTAFITFEPSGTGCHYTVLVKHADKGTRDAHEAMGFSTGWVTAFNQMVEALGRD